jgi:hypothetical protein
MSEEINDLIEDVSEVELQDEALEENVEVENEETIAEDADELEEGKKVAKEEDDEDEDEDDSDDEDDDDVDEKKNVKESASPSTKAGMINAMYKEMSKMNKSDLQAAYDKLMASDDAEADDEDDDDMEESTDVETKATAKESYDFEADLTALVTGEETLSEEFQGKAATIFEAAVKSKVSSEIDRLEEEYKVSLEEETAEFKSTMVDKVDGYLNYVVERWMDENKLAVENGLRNEISESFMEALKGVFVEHYIEVPESKVDLVDDLANQVKELEEQLTQETESNIRLNESVQAFQRTEIIAKASKDLAETEVEKLKGLIEDVDFEDAETFSKKIATIKESYFAKPIVQNNEEIDVATDEDGQEIEISGSMARYASAITRTLQK